MKRINIKVKSTFLIIMIILLSVQLMACGSTAKISNENDDTIKDTMFADWPTYSTVEDLINRADIVILGEVVKVNDPVKTPRKFDFPAGISLADREALEKSPDGYDINTISDVKVIKAIKGQVSIGDILKVYQMGGKIGNEERMLSGVEHYKAGERNVFFMMKSDNGCSALNPSQGDIKIIDGKSKTHIDNKLFKDGVTEEELVKMLDEKVEKLKSSK
jgi:hypothetical protein